MSEGTFAFRTTWLGNGPTPIISGDDFNTAQAEDTILIGVPAGAFFDLTLSTGAYGALDFGAPDVANPGGGILNWQSFLAPGFTCTGVGACSLSAVGSTGTPQAPGRILSGTIGPFDMQITTRIRFPSRGRLGCWVSVWRSSPCAGSRNSPGICRIYCSRSASQCASSCSHVSPKRLAAGVVIDLVAGI